MSIADGEGGGVGAEVNPVLSLLEVRFPHAFVPLLVLNYYLSFAKENVLQLDTALHGQGGFLPLGLHLRPFLLLLHHIQPLLHAQHSLPSGFLLCNGVVLFLHDSAGLETSVLPPVLVLIDYYGTILVINLLNLHYRPSHSKHV